MAAGLPHHERVPVKSLAAACLAVLSLPACVQGEAGGSAAGAADPSRDGVSRAAVITDDPLKKDAGLRGILRADPSTGCLWLDVGGGKAAELLLQGAGYSVDFSTTPASVLDGDRVVATVGKRLDVGGGHTSRPGVPGCPVTTGGAFLGVPLPEDPARVPAWLHKQ